MGVEDMAGTVTLTNEILGRMSTGALLPLSSDVWSGIMERRTDAVYKALSPWVDFVYPVGREKSTSQATEMILSEWARESDFVARTALGKRLVALRAKAIAAGMRLLTEDEVLEEVKRRRGEIEENDANLY
jgi:hypothetical protein